MVETSGKIRQLAPHWVVMFVLMFAILTIGETLFGGLAFWQSLLLVLAVAFGYPIVVRQLGVAPEVWQSK